MMRHGSREKTLQASDGSSLWTRFHSHFFMRPSEDDEPQSWWIASTAIPLVAAAAGPLANVMSVVALVMPWRSTIISRVDGTAGNWVQEGYPDPHWITAVNAVSVAFGVVGNVALLLNFTQSVRYIIALPVTIILWFLAVGMLTGLTASMSIYSPPTGPDEVYSQAYWSAVLAAILYFILAVLLMINMLGYFLGRYPQHFILTNDQRTLILQMTTLMCWLLVGAAIFQRILDISFADALYFCDITVLTLGFGDVTPSTSVGRGIVWPYATIGIIMLGLVVGSIHQFAREVHYSNVVLKHVENRRKYTYNRSVTLADMEDPDIKAKMVYHRKKNRPISNTIHALANNRRPQLIVMREEKDRFDAMRAIQYDTMRFRRWNDLFISVVAFGIVWSCGAVAFWKLEDITYFEALYFCFCSLLTIGYGDFTPKSNAGRPFFVMWSLIAIPTMTMLISQMSDTVVAAFKTATETFANYFVMPQASTYKTFFGRVPYLMQYIQRREEKKRLRHGFEVRVDVDETVDPEDGPSQPVVKKEPLDRPKRTIEELAKDSNLTPYELGQRLAFAIRSAAKDSRDGKRKRYSYEEWVEFTRLIQFTDPNNTGLSVDEDEYGVLNWDWIGENSPMLAQQTEPQWVLDRLCESLIRFVSTLEQSRAVAEGVEEEPTLRKERDLGIEET